MIRTIKNGIKANYLSDLFYFLFPSSYFSQFARSGFMSICNALVYLSFPRKRESRKAFVCWIPACAGMTSLKHNTVMIFTRTYETSSRLFLFFLLPISYFSNTTKGIKDV